jgi:dienelactone hydrolase
MWTFKVPAGTSKAQLLETIAGYGRCMQRNVRMKGAFGAGWLTSLVFAFDPASTSPAQAQERTMMPVSVDGEQVKLAVITYKPAGAGPFPTLIFHHGSTGRGTDPSRFSRTFDPGALAYWFVSCGWAVVLPSRRGRGGSEGLYDEGFSRIRSSGYTCDTELTLRGADRALRDIDAITDAVLALPFVDRTRFVVGGNSRGGILSVAWAGKHPDEPRGVINFVGGWLGSGCPTASAVNQQLFKDRVPRRGVRARWHRAPRRAWPVRSGGHGGQLESEIIAEGSDGFQGLGSC